MILNVEDATKQLSDAVQNRKLVLFCGAGVSIGAGLPTAQQFIESFNLGNLSWQKAATVLANKKNFGQKFNATFGNQTLVPSPQHRLLACLDAPYYITTNYDLLIEKSLEQIPGRLPNDIGVLRKTKDISSVYSYRNLVVKLHGDVESNELRVFDSADYMKRWQVPTAVDRFVSHIFATYHILFVGYSLEDAHILELVQEGIRSEASNLPERYMVVCSMNDQFEGYLDTINVKPILVTKNGQDCENAVCRFLYQLWEQRSDLNIFTRMLNNPDLTPQEKLERAILKRQSGDLKEAQDLLDSFYKQNCQEIRRLDLLSNFLWLNVSVRDKLEDWNALRTIDATYITQLFAELKGKVPESISETLRSAYEASMALAFLRAGDVQEAKKRAESALRYSCTTTAPKGLQINHANCLISHAITTLWCFRMNQNTPCTDLQQASMELTIALQIFKDFGDVASKNESHHLGRYFGTRAFIDIALYDKENKTKISAKWKKEVVGNSERAHMPVLNRTHYGRIAGRYCEAYCHYWLADKVDESERSIHLKRSSDLLSELISEVPDTQAYAHLKVLTLEAEVKKLMEGESYSNNDEKIAKLRNTLTHRRDANQLGTKQWLALPLN